MVTVSVFLYVCVLLTNKVVATIAYIPLARSLQSENNLLFQEETYLNTVSIIRFFITLFRLQLK